MPQNATLTGLHRVRVRGLGHPLDHNGFCGVNRSARIVAGISGMRSPSSPLNLRLGDRVIPGGLGAAAGRRDLPPQLP